MELVLKYQTLRPWPVVALLRVYRGIERNLSRRLAGKSRQPLH
jgi:hypothetical protein